MNRNRSKAVLLALGLALQASEAWAYSSYVTGLNNGVDAAFGTSAQYIGSCDGCHGSNGQSPSMDRQFGVDYLAHKGATWTLTAQNLGPLDSDGDGFNNQAEFIAGTDPSDASSHPAPACVPAAPDLSISPASKSGLAGTSFSYTVSVKNNDSAACGQSSLQLSLGSIPGFAGNLSSQSLSLSPGQLGSSTLIMNSDASLSAGSNSFQVSLADADPSISIHAKSVSGEAVITPAPVCVRATPDLSISPASKAGFAGSALVYSLSVKNNDSSACSSSTLELRLGALPGFTHALSLQSLVLNPGQSGSSDLTLTSDPAITVGSKSFSVQLADSDPAITVHAKSVSGTAVITPMLVCAPAAPTLSVSPASQSAEAGVAKSYSLSVKNNDSSACSPSNFAIALNVASPLSGSLSGMSLNLAPGADGTIEVSIQSATMTAIGGYPFSLEVSDSAVAPHGGSASGALQVVQAPPPPSGDQTPPSVPMNLRLKKKGHRSARIRWDASTDDSSGVAKYQILVDGQKVAETHRLRARVRLSRGSHTITVKAVDRAGNISAESAPLSINI